MECDKFKKEFRNIKELEEWKEHLLDCRSCQEELWKEEDFSKIPEGTPLGYFDEFFKMLAMRLPKEKIIRPRIKPKVLRFIYPALSAAVIIIAITLWLSIRISIGRFQEVKGVVLLKEGKSTKWTMVEKDTGLSEEDLIRTPPGQKATISLAFKKQTNFIKVNEKTVIKIERPRPSEGARLSIDIGEIYAMISPGKDAIAIETRLGTITSTFGEFIAKVEDKTYKDYWSNIGKNPVPEISFLDCLFGQAFGDAPRDAKLKIFVIKGCVTFRYKDAKRVIKEGYLLIVEESKKIASAIKYSKVDEIVRSYSEENWQARYESWIRLKTYLDAGRPICPVLRDLVKDKDYKLKKNAILLLGVLHDRDSIPMLVEILKKEKNLRKEAVLALKRITGEDYGIDKDSRDADIDDAIKKWRN